MRLWPLAILLPVVAPSQIPWSLSPRTLVDALNNDPQGDYTSLLKLLQRARLIPTLNKLNESTFFAPTNDAIKRHSSRNHLWEFVLQQDPQIALNDNVQEQLRQQLFYHLLNYSITIPTDNNTQSHNSSLFPHTPLQPPSRQPPSFPPWMPTPGGSLGGDPQRLRVATRENSTWVGVDAFGSGGSQITKDMVVADNGILFGIADVLDPPPVLAHIVSQHPLISYFNNLLTPDIINLLNTSTELTIFLPVNSAWDALDTYERLYLESGYAVDDLNRILNMHAVVEKKVKYSDSFDSVKSLTTIEGTELEIVVSPDKTTISNARLIQPDIYASNGVLHLVDSLLIPPGALQLTAEKYLLALNCTTFVSLLHSVDLAPLINNTATKYTILAPQDDVLSIYGDGELPDRGSDELRKLLQYHFIPGKWTPEKLENAMLLETVLEEPGLDNGRQVLKVQVSPDEHKPSNKSIRFGGAGIIGESIPINDTLVYFVSRPLVPPSDPLQTALPLLDLSSFLAAVFSTSQAEILRTTPRTSLLIPHNSAFKRLGMLVSAHLLSPSSKVDLENVLLHHVLDTVEYAGSLQNGSQRTFATLEGSDLQIDRKNGTMFVSPSGGWDGMEAELYPLNHLTQTGVVHELSDILIPRSVQLTVGKLVKAAKGSTMASIAIKAGFEWVLNGTAPPEGSPWADKGLSGSGWTLLCPTDEAFKDLNLTKLYADTETLRSIVSQHLIPPPSSSLNSKSSPLASDALYNNRPIPLDDGATYSTMRSSADAYGDIVFRRSEDKDVFEYVVGIKGARGTDGRDDWARVRAWGRSTTGNGGGVIHIDQLLMPYYPSWWVAYGAPTGVGLIGSILICMFFYGVRLVWKRDTTEATYEPQGGFGPDDEP